MSKFVFFPTFTIDTESGTEQATLKI